MVSCRFYGFSEVSQMFIKVFSEALCRFLSGEKKLLSVCVCVCVGGGYSIRMLHEFMKYFLKK